MILPQRSRNTLTETAVEVSLSGCFSDRKRSLRLEIHLQPILRKAARELDEAVKILRNYPRIASEHAVKAKAYENTMEKAHPVALADLFKGTDTVYMLKMREIYHHLSNAADRGDEAANIISGIVMKHS
jgi:uncharacterized protein Yka (UPF0111/DUF47 family)